jgi:large subunit ribosomal protein L14
MIQAQTILKNVDNSGVKLVKCLKVLGYRGRGKGSIDDLAVVSIQKMRSTGNKNLKLKKGMVCLALLIRTKQNKTLKDGKSLKFFSKSCILLSPQGQPYGTRVFGPVLKTLRIKKYFKFISVSDFYF